MRGSGLFILLLIGVLFAHCTSSAGAAAAQAKQNRGELLSSVDSFKGEGTLATPIKVVCNGVHLPEYSKQNSYIYHSAAPASTPHTRNTYPFPLPLYKYRFPAYIVFRSLLI